jgi:hypothetical protein
MNKIIKLVIAVIVLTTATESLAQRGEEPIPLIDVVVEKVPPGIASAARTDRNGYIIYKSLAAGNYIISDRHGNKASVRHPGGPAKWRLVGGIKKRGPVWTLVDESDPL